MIIKNKINFRLTFIADQFMTSQAIFWLKVQLGHYATWFFVVQIVKQLKRVAAKDHLSIIDEHLCDPSNEFHRPKLCCEVNGSLWPEEGRSKADGKVARGHLVMLGMEADVVEDAD